MSHSFLGFFAPRDISTREAGTKAVAAGAIAGCLLTFVSACEFVLRTELLGIKSVSAAFFLGATILSVVATMGTWKRLLSAAATGMVLGVAIIVWLGLRDETVVALVCAVPIIGGFWTAIRGMRVLTQQRQTRISTEPGHP